MITKIVIKSESGYCCVDDAYKDTLTITAASIAYLYTPYLENVANPARKWRYSTNSPAFRKLWEQLTETIPAVLDHDGEPWVTDISDTTFIITYDDGSKVKMEYGLPGDTFQDTFRIVKKMVPGVRDCSGRVQLQKFGTGWQGNSMKESPLSCLSFSLLFPGFLLLINRF